MCSGALCVLEAKGGMKMIKDDSAEFESMEASKRQMLTSGCSINSAQCSIYQNMFLLIK